MIAVLELGAGQLLLAAALVVGGALASLALRLGVGRPLLVAAARAALQLAVLALVLDWIFGRDSALPVLAWMVFVALYAGYEAARRASLTARGVVPGSMAITLVTGMTVAFYGLAAVVRVEPWYDPQYAIPILGMVLGNALNGITLGIDTALAGFRDERDRVEMLLAHGATPREASRDVVRRAVRTGTIPVLNMMAVTGIVSIPGMMTGQLLAGSSPFDAAKYQLFILFAIAGGVLLGTITTAHATARLVFDDRGRLRLDRIHER